MMPNPAFSNLITGLKSKVIVIANIRLLGSSRYLMLSSSIPSVQFSRVIFHVSGICVHRDNLPRVRFGVYVNHPNYVSFISEPLSETEQTSNRVEVVALFVGLELCAITFVRDAVILCDSKYAISEFNTWMVVDKGNSSREENDNYLKNADLRRCIRKSMSTMTKRDVNIESRWAPKCSTKGLIEADRLARKGCEMQWKCPLCERYVGRKMGQHVCHPVCNKGTCEQRKFVNLDAFLKHSTMCHGIKHKCRRPDCNAVFGSKKSLLSHENMAHNGQVFECRFCNLIFCSENIRRNHEVKNCAFSSHRSMCRKSFGHFSALHQHKHDFHPIGR